MSLKKYIAVQAVSAGLLFAAATSQAQVTLAIIDPNNGSPGNSFCEYAGISATLNNSTLISPGADWIGIYSFAVQPGSSPNLSSPFYSVCVSPEGNLPPGSQTYNISSFSAAAPGLNPSSWSAGTASIQNANYLFSTFSSAIIAGTAASQFHLIGSTADQGAALALAMYAALYNSTGYGTLGGSAFANTSTVGAVDTDYGDILSALTGSAAVCAAVQATAGDVLVPTLSSSQELILLGTDLPNGFGVVPETTTVLAGLLLLLPFIGSAIRILRKNSAS